ncbi:dTDP-4-dehydrorhamnose 3,5-epimerase family protein [Patescibacteria group bacterium]|nr:dTDP-4-dehydrorhamnose 3,5-epimerase family protein [Patescibacteria group bacterium]MBU4579692.1 dTDP-4-dehydrorhamnose 3,5-epimerase family protein [Patescibacteria group bacterium]
MIQDVIIKKLKKNEDARGWLAEIYRNDEFEYTPAMSYVSATKPGVIRGPHEHKAQSDFFVFMGPGRFRLYLWDNRADSVSYKEKMELEGGEDNKIAVLVPPGVAHGYKCISDIDAWCVNLPNKLYAGVDKKGEVDEIRWEKDPASPFKIE